MHIPATLADAAGEAETELEGHDSDLPSSPVFVILDFYGRDIDLSPFLQILHVHDESHRESMHVAE